MKINERGGVSDGLGWMMFSPPLFLLKYPFFYEAKLTKYRYQTFTMFSMFQRTCPHCHPRDRQYGTASKHFKFISTHTATQSALASR